MPQFVRTRMAPAGAAPRGRVKAYRAVASAVLFGLLVCALPPLQSARAQASPKLVGNWKTKAKFAGYDQTIRVARDGERWSVDGTFEKDGKVVGTFGGEDVKVVGETLTYRSKFIKKPVESWQDNDTTLRMDGDALVSSFVAKNGEKIVRAFARTSAEPKAVAEKTPPPPDPKTEPAKTPPTDPKVVAEKTPPPDPKAVAGKSPPSTKTTPDGTAADKPRPVWTGDLNKMVIPDAPITGRVAGREFQPNGASYDPDFRFLRFEQGKSGDFKDLGIRIELAGVATKGKVPEGKTFKQAINAPVTGKDIHFEVSYREEPGKGMPKGVVSMNGAIVVEFGKVNKKTEKVNKFLTRHTATVPVKIYVCLPDKDKTFLAGTFEVKINETAR